MLAASSLGLGSLVPILRQFCSVGHIKQFSSASQQHGSYLVNVSLQAFEPRYIEYASSVIRDLLLVHFVPKSNDSLPAKEISVRPLNLFMPIERKTIRIAPKRFTLIRGPFAKKRGQENFEIRRFKTILHASTHCNLELQWFLDNLKLYDFTGVQLDVNVTSSSYLLPTDATSTSESGILNSHANKIKRFKSPDVQTSDLSFALQLDDSLQSIRSAMFSGQQVQRQAIASSEAYRTWFNAYASRMARKVEASNADLDKNVSSWLHQQQFLKHHMKGLKASLQESKTSKYKDKASAFLAAVDAVLLNVRFDTLEWYQKYHLHAFSLSPGQKIEAALWIHTLLKCAEFNKALAQKSQEESLLKEYVSYNLFSHALLFSLFRLWMGHCASQAQKHFLLPNATQTKAFMADVTARGGKKRN